MAPLVTNDDSGNIGTNIEVEFVCILGSSLCFFSLNIKVDPIVKISYEYYLDYYNCNKRLKICIHLYSLVFSCILQDFKR